MDVCAVSEKKVTYVTTYTITFEDGEIERFLADLKAVVKGGADADALGRMGKFTDALEDYIKHEPTEDDA